jgi:hypothetical protein
MSNDVLVPPAELIDDFPALKTDIENDRTGEKTRRLLRFFGEAAVQSQEMQLQSAEYGEKEFARLMHDCFSAAQRIVSRTWESTHRAPLAG